MESVSRQCVLVEERSHVWFWSFESEVLLKYPREVKYNRSSPIQFFKSKSHIVITCKIMFVIEFNQCRKVQLLK